MYFTLLNPESDLQCLEENLYQCAIEESERLCKELSNKYDAAAGWIQQKECIDNPKLFFKRMRLVKHSFQMI